jgi:coenzyme Q-binding protein COQ10
LSTVISQTSPGGYHIDFYVDFEFKSHVLQKRIEVLFSEAVRRMVGAVEKRAHDVYGAPSLGDAGRAAV